MALSPALDALLLTKAVNKNMASRTIFHAGEKERFDFQYGVQIISVRPLIAAEWDRY